MWILYVRSDYNSGILSWGPDKRSYPSKTNMSKSWAGRLGASASKSAEAGMTMVQSTVHKKTHLCYTQAIASVGRSGIGMQTMTIRRGLRPRRLGGYLKYPLPDPFLKRLDPVFASIFHPRPGFA